MKRAIFFTLSFLLLCTVLRKLITSDGTYVSFSSLLTYLETAPILDVSQVNNDTWKFLNIINWPNWLNFIIPLFKFLEPAFRFIAFLLMTLYNFMIYVYYFFSFIFSI